MHVSVLKLNLIKHFFCVQFKNKDIRYVYHLQADDCKICVYQDLKLKAIKYIGV